MQRSVRRWLVGALTAAMASAGAVTVTPPPASADLTATADTVYYWNSVLQETFRRQGGGPGPLARAAAIMHAGVHDAINSAWWSTQQGVGNGYHNYGVDWIVGPQVDGDLAAGYTARDLLVAALPAQAAYVQQAFTDRYGTRSQTDARRLADLVINGDKYDRVGDGSADTTSYTLDNVPGAWRPTGNTCLTAANAVDPHWGAVKPFSLTSGSQFRRSGPAGYTSYSALLSSSAYATQVNEVKALGRATGSTRTADQTQAAWFWANDLDGTYKPPGQYLALTETVSRARLTEARQVARLFARVGLAMADASIAAWDEKYRTSLDLWRPETAIQLADTDNNPATVADPAWRPLSADRSNVSFSPCFPAWVSGHATIGAAWAGIMRSTFGDAVSFVGRTEDPHAVGVTRSFTSFTQAATENARSRIYLGVHYSFDGDDGQAIGYDVASWVYPRHFGTFNCPITCW
ncbi:vanadium-dependent haloperoxidase [Micromonospora sp. B11E3]|uniref:vanadium-dependent haloperoxidase n=1 Tax=Micromonospora sp. B11E3 TaxID=3153562 RepID=UPI00325F89D8